MAYAKKYPHIKYKDGVRGKHGVAFETLSKLHKRFLLEHPNVKDFVKDEQKLKAVLGLFRGTNDRHKTKLFYDWVEGDLKKIDDVYDSYRSIDWTCAISGRPIKSKMGDFSARNFVHPEYWDALEIGINQNVLKSSLEFRQKCQQLLLNEQKELMKVFKKNANPRKRLD
jgi:hypothetical protein